jgi:hypothetical protein
VKVRLLLARQAEVQAGLLYALGLGFTEAGPDPAPFAICALVEIAWDETNRQHDLVFRIEDLDGQPFQVPTPTGDQPFQVAVQFDVGRPAGVTPGRSFIMPVCVNLAALPLVPGSQYLVRVSVDTVPLDETPLNVRPRPQQIPAPGA